MKTPESHSSSPPEFVKRGVVVAGQTPSCISGEKSEIIKHGEAVRKDEQPVDFEKLAAEL